MEKFIMEDNMERNQNEPKVEAEQDINQEAAKENEAPKAPASPSKPPMNKKAMIGIIVGAVAVVAIIIALVLGLGGKDNGHTCSFGEWTVVTEATCTQGGVKERACSCGEKETEAIAATGHDWKAATCQSPKMCKECFTVEGSVGSHTYTESIATPDALKSEASCTGAAVYYKSCICGKVSDSDSDTFTNGTATEHNYVKTSSTEADCERAATETYVCDCGSKYTDTIGDALGHSISDVTPVERPVEGSTCEYVWVYICSADECGKEVEGERVSYHNYVASITTYPTCKNDGEKTLTCSCGDSYTESIEKNSTGHKWNKGEINEGVRTDTCEYCAETKTVTVFEGTTTDKINSGDLKDTEIEINDANISLDEGVVDSIGDKSVTISAEKLGNDDVSGLLNQDQLAQVGDSPIYNFTINDGTNNISKFGKDNFVTITLPYTLQEGEDVDSIAIWFIADDGQLESIKATYNNGFVTFKTNHFSYYTVTRLTPKERCKLYGHNYAEQSFAGSCTQDGYLLKVCVRCHESNKTITSTAQGHDFTEELHSASCTENGYIAYDCKNCDYSYVKTQNATGHSFEAGKKEESTCSKNGYESFKCANCDEEYTNILPKLDHQMVEEKITKEATCVENGIKVIICANCDESVLVDIPATGNHSYENGVCTQCGQESSAAVKLDGIVIRIEDLSYSLNRKDEKLNKWELQGSIEQIDIAELMIYVEDGELYGAAIGSVNYYEKWNGTTTTYALRAIIEDGFIYYHVDNIKGAFKQDAEGKISIEELLSESVLPDEEITDKAASFINDSLIPAIEALVKNNAERIDEIVDDALNILFTTENKADGSKVISLDNEKLTALKENLATKTVAEVIDIYFGEGSVDELYSTALDALNTVITDIPGIVTEQGIDLDKLLSECESFCETAGIPLDLDSIRDTLYGEDYSDITIGMLVFGTEDKSYEENVKKVFDVLREMTLYQLISEDDADDIKDTVDGVIDSISEKIGLSFTINSAGQLVDIDLNVIDLTLEMGEQSHHINMCLDISFTGRIDVSWSDIIDEINSGILIPDDELLDKELQTGEYRTSGEMTYKGVEYYYDGQSYYSYVADYDRMIRYTTASNCTDWRSYDYSFATVGYEVSIRNLKTSYDSSKTVYTVIVDTTTGEAVELDISENGATATYEDGTTKELTANDFASLENLYKVIFGDVKHENFYRQENVYFYYNSKTNEYSDNSRHEYEEKYELQGESCEDGVVVTYTCKNCGDSYTRNYSYHDTNHETIDLSEYGACNGSIEINQCACGEEFSIYLNWDTCGSQSYNEYYDDFGRLVSVSARSCRDCGLRAEISQYTVPASELCHKTTHYNVVVSVGETLVMDDNYSNTYVSHDYKVVGQLMEGSDSCDDGAILVYTCKDCGDSYENKITWHERYVKDTIDFSSLGSVCGGYAEITTCACGEYLDLSLNHSLCDFNTKYCNLWIDNVITEGQYTTDGHTWYGYDSYIYTCAVTDPEACAFKIRYASYWLYDGNCTATCYETWQFDYDEERDTYAKEYTFAVDSRVYHNYTKTVLDNGERYDCSNCGSYYSNMNYYNSDGYLIKSEIIAENTLNRGTKYYDSISEYEYDNDGNQISEYDHNKRIYEDGRISENEYKSIVINDHSYILFDYSNDGDGWWYRYDYTYNFDNGCYRTCTYTNSYGENRVETENCCKYYWTTIESPTCSQDGLQGRHCSVCGSSSDTDTIMPTDHNWVYISENHYYCFNCGLENENGISGNIILEDLTELYGNDRDYVVGYYAYDEISFTYYVSLILDDGTEIILDGVSFNESDSPRAIFFSKSEVESAITRQGYSLDDGDVRFAFVPYGSDGSFDYAITFTETVNIDTIVDSVSFVEYIGEDETISFTIIPNESGMWYFTSMSDYDSYAYLYDANGNELYCNDDGGFNTNFRIDYYLEAGETYTLSVRWLNSDVAGSMPLIFTFEG